MLAALVRRAQRQRASAQIGVFFFKRMKRNTLVTRSPTIDLCTVIDIPADIHQARVALRQICASDRTALAAFFSDLSHQSRYARFFHPVAELSNSLLESLSEVDGDRHQAWILYEVGSGNRVLGEARLMRDAFGAAELALCISDAWQRKGFGSYLLRFLEHRAVTNGIKDVYGEALFDNLPIQKLCRRRQFTATLGRDAGLIHLEKRLPDCADSSEAMGNVSVGQLIRVSFASDL